jgi:LPXTG-motif cell wall-anchored protein
VAVAAATAVLTPLTLLSSPVAFADDPAPSSSPQGGPGATADSGHLAATGAGDALPPVAATGAAAVTLGAAALLAVRRRKAASART